MTQFYPSIHSTGTVPCLLQAGLYFSAGRRPSKLGVEGPSGRWPGGSRKGLQELVVTEFSLKL